MRAQVVVDVPRTAPGVPFFAQAQLQQSLERILFLWGIRCGTLALFPPVPAHLPACTCFSNRRPPA